MRSVLYTFAPVQTTSQAPVFLRFFRLQSEEGITTPHSLQGWFDFCNRQRSKSSSRSSSKSCLSDKKAAKMRLTGPSMIPTQLFVLPTRFKGGPWGDPARLLGFRCLTTQKSPSFS